MSQHTGGTTADDWTAVRTKSFGNRRQFAINAALFGGLFAAGLPGATAHISLVPAVAIGGIVTATVYAVLTHLALWLRTWVSASTADTTKPREGPSPDN